MRIVVHAGFLRTATTTLQEAVFQSLPGVNYLGRPFVHAEIADAMQALLLTDGVRYDSGRVRDAFARHLDAGRLNLLSYENLASFKAKDKKLIAGRVQEVFPDAIVLFTIRNQYDLVRSWYLFQRMPPRRFASFQSWWARIATHVDAGVLDDINFDDTITCYEQLFGRDRVRVVTYESLRDDPDGFAAAVAAGTGLDAAPIAMALKRRRLNPGATTRHLAFARALEEYVPAALARAGGRMVPASVAARFGRWQARGAQPRLVLSPEQKQVISDLCAEGNARLAERFGLPLSAYGYPL